MSWLMINNAIDTCEAYLKGLEDYRSGKSKQCPYNDEDMKKYWNDGYENGLFISSMNN